LATIVDGFVWIWVRYLYFDFTWLERQAAASTSTSTLPPQKTKQAEKTQIRKNERRKICISNKVNKDLCYKNKSGKRQKIWVSRNHFFSVCNVFSAKGFFLHRKQKTVFISKKRIFGDIHFLFSICYLHLFILCVYIFYSFIFRMQRFLFSKVIYFVLFFARA